MNPISDLRLPVMPDATRALSPDMARPNIPVYELGKMEVGKISPDATVKSGGMAQSISSAPSSFESTLGRMVAEVSGKAAAAGDATAALMSGDKVALHQAVIAGEEASLSFQLMVEVRNKLLESYQELMRMQV